MVSIKYALNSKGTVHNIFVTKGSSIGGGINFSASVSNGNISPKVPNLSVVHDKVEKEQITRATAINTEISLKGKEVSAEELGFNTDKEKSQEVTKDNEKHLNADLHTDLANKENRDSSISKPDELESVNINLSADVEIVKNLLGAEGTLSYDLKSGTINTGATLDFDITPDKIKNIGD